MHAGKDKSYFFKKTVNSGYFSCGARLWFRLSEYSFGNYSEWTRYMVNLHETALIFTIALFMI